MISEADLLSADAAIFAGVLIFLTLGPVSRGMVSEIFEKRLLLVSLVISLTLLTASITSVLVPENVWESSFNVGIGLFIAALFVVVFMVALLLYFLPGYIRKQKGAV